MSHIVSRSSEQPVVAVQTLHSFWIPVPGIGFGRGAETVLAGALDKTCHSRRDSADDDRVVTVSITPGSQARWERLRIFIAYDFLPWAVCMGMVFGVLAFVEAAARWWFS